MAKAFYSMEEVCDLLGKGQDDIKEMVRAGDLREFRDAGKIFFKAEDVNKLAGTENVNDDSGEIMLAAAPELESSDLSDMPTLDDDDGTSMLGLAAMDDAEPTPERSGPKVAKSSIGVFDDDEMDIDADPMAETQITASITRDKVALEGSGSGSGLLDLTRESDDTSLGAELLDEIYPGEEDAEEAEPAAEEPEEAEEAEEAEEVDERPVVSVVETMPMAAITASDSSEGLFSGLMVGALLVLVVAGSVVGGSLQGFFPDYAKFLSNNFWYLLIGAVLAPIIAMLIGWVIGKASVPKRA